MERRGAEGMEQRIARFFDGEARLKQLPARLALREPAHGCLAEKSAPGRDYTGREVNAIPADWHTFGGHVTPRCGLMDGARLFRTRDGGRYRRNPDRKREDGP